MVEYDRLDNFLRQYVFLVTVFEPTDSSSGNTQAAVNYMLSVRRRVQKVNRSCCS